MEDAQELVEICEGFMKDMGLRINEEKTVIIVKGKQDGEDVGVVVNGKKIQAISGKKAFRVLGVYINEALEWEEQFQIIKKKLVNDSYRLNQKKMSTRDKVTIMNIML